MDLFLPALLAGEASMMAECHPAELEGLQTHHPNLANHFQIVRFDPFPANLMPGIMGEYLRRKSPGLEIERNGLRRLTQHLDFFQRDMAFPGKAFRFLDWLVQRERDQLPKGGASEGDEKRVLHGEAVSRAFSDATGLPLDLIADDRVAGPEHIAERLREGVVGQDRACSTCARVLARFKAGIDDPDRPIGSLFFVGPTGVGKTEMAKQLARYMFGNADRMIRVDMSEYMLPGSSQRLLAVGPGVRSLAEQVRQQPLSLVLLDELEKADAQVFDLLLAILGEGRLTDDDGRLVDFRMTLICMTSNLGVHEREAAGFAGPEGSAEDERDKGFLRVVRSHFRPEFFNRIDHVVPFRRLSTEDIRRIVDLELAKLRERSGLLRREIRLRVTPAARDLLAERGWHPTRGARPLQRVLEEQVMAPLSVLLAANPQLERATFDVRTRDEASRGEREIELP
jgi:ATP-dependent Clp protease ATP-binding subunit ClpC